MQRSTSANFAVGPRRCGVYVVLLAGMFAWGTSIASDGLRVLGVQPRITNATLALSGNVELNLTPKVEEALNNGIPLEFVIDVQLSRHRTLWWDETVDTWTLRREIRYHALSGQYLVSGQPPMPDNRESYTELSEALPQAGSLDGVRLLIEPELSQKADYRVGIRARLDIEALPPLLRPVAYTSRAWDLNSGWTTWTLRQ